MSYEVRGKEMRHAHGVVQMKLKNTIYDVSRDDSDKNLVTNNLINLSW